MKLIIYGSREFAKVVKQLAVDCGHDVVGFIDDSAPELDPTRAKVKSSEPLVFPYKCLSRFYSPTEIGIALGVGYKDLSARHGLYLKLKKDGYKLPTLVHAKAYVHPSTKIGEGCLIMATAAVDVFCDISEIVTLWPGSVVSHDSQIGANTFISPSATLCGFTKVGAHCFVGAGSVIVDHREVPEKSFVKAGSVFKGNRTR